jgi:hypothetical protein
MADNQNSIFEVLSPWAEADPVPPRGITPRLDKLDGKTIGLFRNSKRAAVPLMEVIGNRLKEKYPNIKITEFANLKANEIITAHEAKDEFEEWIKGVDAVINTYGD